MNILKKSPYLLEMHTEVIMFEILSCPEFISYKSSAVEMVNSP